VDSRDRILVPSSLPSLLLPGVPVVRTTGEGADDSTPPFLTRGVVIGRVESTETVWRIGWEDGHVVPKATRDFEVNLLAPAGCDRLARWLADKVKLPQGPTAPRWYYDGMWWRLEVCDDEGMSSYHNFAGVSPLSDSRRNTYVPGLHGIEPKMRFGAIRALRLAALGIA
jgi:hypothetical protein